MIKGYNFNQRFKFDINLKNICFIAYTLINIIIIHPVRVSAQMNPEAEKYISIMLERKVPYNVQILDSNFIIRNNQSYEPGKLTVMFFKYLLENDLVKNKVVADIGAGCFALGILAAKNGAKEVIGIDITDEAINCAKENIINNNVENKTTIIQGNGVTPLSPKFKKKVDLLLSGAPWDTISTEEFNQISNQRKSISRAFYDVDNHLIIDVLSKGFLFLSPTGKIFITGSLRTMDRIKTLCAIYKMNYKIVKEEDTHRDGNIHYIIEITRTIE